MTSLNKFKAMKEAAEDEAKREKANAKKVAKSNEELKNTLEAAKKIKTNLEANVDMAEAKVSHAEAEKKLAQEALAKVEAEVDDKINAGKDELIDLAMYRIWEHNQNIDISFMEGEVEGMLKKMESLVGRGERALVYYDQRGSCRD